MLVRDLTVKKGPCMLKYSLLMSCFVLTFAQANIGKTKGFTNYKNYYFVETGTFGGEAIRRALKDGFIEAYSIEMNPRLFADCRNRFARSKNVHIYNGNSAEILWDVIRPLNKPITFWLDAHRGPGEYLNDGKNSPIMFELEQIARHPIKTHTILIDDVSGCGGISFDYHTLDQIKAKISEINPKYTFQLIVGGENDEALNNILVAQVLE